MSQQAETCELCGRHVPRRLTSVHHLCPRSHGGGPDGEVILCKLCHSFLHATFTNSTLAEEFSSLDALRRDPEVRRFVRWARKQKPHRDIEMDSREERR